MGSATPKSPLNLQNSGSFYGHLAIPLLVNYDTPGEILTLRSYPTGIIFVVGWELVCANAANVSLRSGSETWVTYAFGPNSGQGEPFQPSNPGIIMNTESGNDLIMQCNSVLPPHLMYIVEI